MFVPYVVEAGEHGETRHDVFSRLLKDRIVWIGTAINAEVANVVIAQLLFLSSSDPTSPIKVYINSPGGSVSAGLAIYDCMNLIPCPIETICVGMAASMGAVILSGGTPGMRKILPNSTVMIHQPSNAGVGGQASDIEISTKRILKLRSTLNQILADNTGQDLSQIESDCDRDHWMDASESLAYGIVDQIIGARKTTEIEVVSELEA